MRAESSIDGRLYFCTEHAGQDLRLHNEKVPQSELSMVKNYTIGDLCRTYESPFSLADAYIYLDTYAWILYLQGYYSLSKIYIERALKYTAKEDIPAEYWEHYGYILYKLDKPSEAIEAWKKAIESGSENQEIIFEIEQHEKNQ